MNKKQYSHFVLTRFNIRIKFGYSDRDPEGRLFDKILDEDYLNQRFSLFEKYTLPSILNQTCKNFSYVLLFHKKTPRKFLDKISAIMPPPLRIITCLLDDGEKFSFPDFIRSEQLDPSDYFITSRIDNDDAYERTYIERVQKFVSSLTDKKTCFISFPLGEQLDIKSGHGRLFMYDSNHFTSMLAPAETNILQYDHGYIKDTGHEIICLSTYKPMWTEIIHELNYSNQLRFRASKFTLRNFVVDILRKIPFLYVILKKARDKIFKNA